MADKAPTAVDALKQLEQHLTCPVCLDCYTQPRTLPCLHSFCHQCLGAFPVQVEGGNRRITCPVCRQTSQQTDKGVSGYQPAFLINNFLELRGLLEKVSSSKQDGCENCHKDEATGYCKQCSILLCQTCIDMHNKWGKFTSHQILGVEDVVTTASKLVPLKELPTMECTSHGKPLEVYCDTCDQLICQLCTTARAHRNHEYEPITDAFPRHQQHIVDSLQRVKEKLAAITATVHVLETQEGGFLKHIQAVRREIETTVHHLIQLLQKSERQLMKELDQVADTYVEKITACKKEADIAIAQLKSCEQFTEDELRADNQQEILVMKRQMVERMGTVCSQVKEDNLQPLKKIRLKFVKNTGVVKACHSLGSVVKCSRVKVASNNTSFDLCSAASNSPLSSELMISCQCQLSPVADPTIVFECVTQQVSPCSFEVLYPPSTTGLHQLRVLVGGADLFDTPLTVEVTPRKAGQVYKGLQYPFGLAVTHDGCLIVATGNVTGNSCITIINTTSGERTSIGQRGSGQGRFDCPQGVALSQEGNIIVADYFNHRIQVLTVDGAFVSAVGSKGSQPLQFIKPCDVAVHQNGRLFVADSGNNRVQVFNRDLTYLHSFGSGGSRPGEFGNPCGVAIDSKGMVHVADRNNNRVQKFTPRGKFLAVIDTKERQGSRLNRPYGLCVDSNDILYVTECDSNTVCMFSTSGQFLGYVGNSNGSSFNYPKFITSDQYGKLYISDKYVVTVY